MSLPHTALFYGSVEEAYLDTIKSICHDKQLRVSFFPISKLFTVTHNHFSHYAVCGSLGEVKEVLSFAMIEHVSVGIVPLPSQKKLMRTFALPSSLEEAVTLAASPSEKRVDMLLCNREIVLHEVTAGDVPPLDRYEGSVSSSQNWGRMGLFFHTLRKVSTLHHRRFYLKDGEGKALSFSAVGLVALEYNTGTFASKLLSRQLNAEDGKLSMLILSPVSMLQYVGYLFRTLMPGELKQLPRSLGYLRTEKMHIESDSPQEVVIDGEVRQQTPVTLQVEKQALRISVGEAFWENQCSGVKGKSSMKIDHLPSDEESAAYLSKSLPLFSHASQEQYASLFSALREEAKLTSTFMSLLILATMIATLGLFINSASVIIGAMLLAPLMQPIVSLSMAALRQESTMELTALKTITVGVASVLLTAALIAWMMPIAKLTTEMAGRLSPTIIDLFVAIVSGAAAAYAKSNEKISASLAGVAIAVALVPPIAVAGIGIGWGEWQMFTSSFLLFLTNLIGIVLAAALTFMVLGYSPLHIAKKGIIVWLLITAVVSVPLYSAFKKMQLHTGLQTALGNAVFTLDQHHVVLTHIEPVEKVDHIQIRCEVISNGYLTKAEKVLLKRKIMEKAGENVEVIVTFRYRL